ncbi:MAG: sterol desaturase family protein [Myxococcota bacterium]|nr:sterol desaturase family protein [Myxococcota bacterium]
MIAILVTGLTAAGMMGIEAGRPGRRLPRVAGFHRRAFALTAIQAGVVALAGLTWDAWMKQHQLFSGAGLGTLGGAAVGYLAITFVYYWWHRARHEVPVLWRWLHQLHHSPGRLQVMTSFYKHPLEVLANGVLSSAILYLGVGLAPAAAGLAVLLTGLAELFYHWNVRTPRWLGFLIQRPESHCVHHQRGRHSGNYADLPLWDWLFGTLHNPHHFDADCGFDGDREQRLGDMLRGIDVNASEDLEEEARSCA